MSKVRPKRVCSTPGCGAVIGTQGKTGMCRPHALAAMHADPAYCERLQAGQRRFLADRDAVAARSAKMLAGVDRYRANMTPEQRAQAREHGRWLYQTHASRPDVVARSQSPDARRRSAEKAAEAKLAWCPLDRRDEYKRLVRRRIPAVEARRIIEAETPGTREHARREVASFELAARLRRERIERDAY